MSLDIGQKELVKVFEKHGVRIPEEAKKFSHKFDEFLEGNAYMLNPGESSSILQRQSFQILWYGFVFLATASIAAGWHLAANDKSIFWVLLLCGAINFVSFLISITIFFIGTKDKTKGA